MGSLPSLKPGDKIGIVSPSGRIEKGRLDAAIEIFEGWGLKVITGKHVYSGYNQFGGTDSERASDFQRILDDDEIKAVFCSRGGYGTVRIIDLLDFTSFISSPKWIIGYSDITVLHSHIYQSFGISTLHAPMPAEFTPGKKHPVSSISLNHLKEILFGQLPVYKFPGHHLSRQGEVSGVLAGGNLSVLYSIMGSPSAVDMRGKILFIEDVGEYLYHIDRMMISLERSGVLRGIVALIVGGMTDMNDNKVPFGKTAEEIVAGLVARYDYPVAFGFPAGHQPLNNPLLMGQEVVLSVGETSCMLSFPG